MTGRGSPPYLIVVRASALASISGSYNSTAQAPSRIQLIKLGGGSSGSLLSPARKLLRLSFAGSSTFIEPYCVFGSFALTRTLFSSKIEGFVLHTGFSYDALRCINKRIGSYRSSQSIDFRSLGQAFSTAARLRGRDSYRRVVRKT